MFFNILDYNFEGMFFTMSIGDIITYIMLFFALIGAADRAIGCKFGPGKSFEKGFEATGALLCIEAAIPYSIYEITEQEFIDKIVARYLDPANRCYHRRAH